jgi:5-methyltetrahydrofolate--homocysteine methyltransferase
MLIVGELFNTSRKVILENVEKRNTGYIRDIAQRQVEAGADYLDVNCGDVLDEEVEALGWLIENIQAVVDVPLCIDTPNPVAMEFGLSCAKNGQPLVNSITGEEDRYNAMLPLIIKYKAKVVALTIDKQGIPQAVEDRLRVTRQLVKNLTGAGVAVDDIYLDLLVQPLATGDRAGLELLNVVRLVKQEFPECHLLSGLSNISFGLPNRGVLNRIFMIQTLTLGMDAYILDPLDKTLMGYLYATQALLGQDQFCAKYLAAHRKGFYKS